MTLFPLFLNFLLNFQEAAAETTTGAFDDLGKLLLGGVVAAIVLALGFTLIRMLMRDKKPQGSGFISINAVENERSSRG